MFPGQIFKDKDSLTSEESELKTQMEDKVKELHDLYKKLYQLVGDSQEKEMPVTGAKTLLDNSLDKAILALTTV